MAELAVPPLALPRLRALLGRRAQLDREIACLAAGVLAAAGVDDRRLEGIDEERMVILYADEGEGE